MSNRTRLFVNELVEKYHLGTPQKVYAQRWKYYVMVICACLLFVIWIFTIVAYLSGENARRRYIEFSVRNSGKDAILR